MPFTLVTTISWMKLAHLLSMSLSALFHNKMQRKRPLACEFLKGEFLMRAFPFSHCFSCICGHFSELTEQLRLERWHFSHYLTNKKELWCFLWRREFCSRVVGVTVWTPVWKWLQFVHFLMLQILSYRFATGLSFLNLPPLLRWMADG